MLDAIVDAQVRVELRKIRESLEDTLATVRLLLALRLVDDGHARDLRAGLELARDIDRVKALYPVEFDEDAESSDATDPVSV